MSGGEGRITLLGAGSFGTALAVQLASNGRPVTLWARRESLAREIREHRRNEEYLPGVELPPGVTVTASLAAAAGAETTLVAVPSHGFRKVLRDFLAAAGNGRPLVVVSATKGIETESLARMSQVAGEEGRAVGREVRFAVLSGPSFAAELARGVPTAAVVGSSDEELAHRLRGDLASPTFRLYSSDDVVGVELGGTAKNVIAIAAGILVGLGLGHNTLAALITRGLHEITRLGMAYGGHSRTFAGLAGLGDLVLTCTGGLSRNRAIGLELATGKSIGEITAGTHTVAEGIRNSLAVARLARQREVDMPIVEQMVRILYEGKAAEVALGELMTREPKAEAEL